MKIAIIDDGIYVNSQRIKTKVENYIVKYGVIKERSNKSFNIKNETSHGTKCAYILMNLFWDFIMIDIKIIHDEKRGDINDLVVALKWCLQNDVNIINLSLGTLNYHDQNVLSDIIEKLILKNVFVVCAIDNSNLVSFPAFCKGTFAVAAYMNDDLSEGIYGISKNNKYAIEKSFLARYAREIKKIDDDKYIELELGNSFAAPILVGKIANILKYNIGLSYNQVLDKLVNDAVPISDDAVKIERKLRFHNYYTNIPIIEIPDHCILIELSKKLKNKGYKIEILSDIRGKGFIPVDFYSESERIDKDVLNTIDFIYKPDILFINVQNNYRPIFDRYWTLIDALILYNKTTIIWTTKKESKDFHSMEDVCIKICQYFS